MTHASPSRPPVVLMAGGGSGGHIAPGLAIAERLLERSPQARVLFACSSRGVDRRMLDAAGRTFRALPAQPLSLRPAGAWRFARGFVASRRVVGRLLREESVTHVVALGGFVAAPAVAAARRAGVRTLLLNLDVPPGKANRWLAGRCDEVVTAIELPPGKRPFPARVVGMPIRRSAIRAEPADRCRRLLGLAPDRPTLLVLGGSQGAGTLNDLLAALVEAAPETFARWQLLHVSGAAAAGRLRAIYAERGVPARVEAFLDRMDLAWGAADLAVSRAGANSVGEAVANAVPTVFLPYPYHRDQHQRFNAAPLERRGAAVVCEDLVDPQANAGAGGAAILELMRDADRRQAMAEALRRDAADDAAELLARMLVGEGGDPHGGPRDGAFSLASAS